MSIAIYNPTGITSPLIDNADKQSTAPDPTQKRNNTSKPIQELHYEPWQQSQSLDTTNSTRIYERQPGWISNMTVLINARLSAH